MVDFNTAALLEVCADQEAEQEWGKEEEEEVEEVLPTEVLQKTGICRSLLQLVTLFHTTRHRSLETE